jgi:hypothetical protein
MISDYVLSALQNKDERKQGNPSQEKEMDLSEMRKNKVFNTEQEKEC